VTAEHERTGAIEAVERIVNRGGEADDVLRAVLQVLFELYAYVAIWFVEGDDVVEGPSLGTREEGAERVGIAFLGMKVGELEVAWPDSHDRPFLERIATLISGNCLVGWDTGGEAWEP
jgi:hypothetical protein